MFSRGTFALSVYNYVGTFVQVTNWTLSQVIIMIHTLKILNKKV